MGILPDTTLVDDTLSIFVNELDRVLDGHDMAAAVAVASVAADVVLCGEVETMDTAVVTVVVVGRETGGVAHGAVDVEHQPAASTDQVVMVVAHPILEARHWGIADGKDVTAAAYHRTHSCYAVAAFHEAFGPMKHLEEAWRRAEELARQSGAQISWSEDPREAVRDATFVYTDTWTSMGQEEEQQQRMAVFQPLPSSSSPPNSSSNTSS